MKTVKILILVLVASFATSVTMAQKFGSVKQGELIQKLVDKDSVQQKLEAYYKDVQENLDGMMAEFQTKYQDFQKNVASYSEAVRTQKERDLQRLQQSIQEFEQLSQEKVTKYRSDLMEPLFAKFKEAVTKIGKESQYTLVFAEDQPLYVNPTTVTDITELVRKALGL